MLGNDVMLNKGGGVEFFFWPENRAEKQKQCFSYRNVMLRNISEV